MNHKNVCWEDYSIPVPTWASWLTWDEDGNVWIHEREPTIKNSGTFSLRGGWYSRGRMDRLSFAKDVTPPEHGAWREQIYTIA